MKLIFIILTIIVGFTSEIKAMSVEDQELVSVGIYRKACKVGLVSPKGRNYVRRIANLNIHSNGLFQEDRIRIDLHHLISKAFIQAWKIYANWGQFYNGYMNFLLEHKVLTNDVCDLFKILNKYNSNVARSEDQSSVIRELYPILNKFTPDADYYRDMTYVTNYIRDPKDVVMFYEVVARNLTSLGLEKTFFNISRARFAQIDRIGDIDLDRKKNCLINEYQNRFIRESWLKNLYIDAVRYGVIPLEEWNHILSIEEKVGIHPVRIVTNAAIKMVVSDFRLCDFLGKYGVHHSSIFKMIPTIKSFLDPNIKMIQYVNGLQRVLRTISDDMARIGISDGAYYVPKESLVSNLQKG